MKDKERVDAHIWPDSMDTVDNDGSKTIDVEEHNGTNRLGH